MLRYYLVGASLAIVPEKATESKEYLDKAKKILSIVHDKTTDETVKQELKDLLKDLDERVRPVFRVIV